MKSLEDAVKTWLEHHINWRKQNRLALQAPLSYVPELAYEVDLKTVKTVFNTPFDALMNQLGNPNRSQSPEAIAAVGQELLIAPDRLKRYVDIHMPALSDLVAQFLLPSQLNQVKT